MSQIVKEEDMGKIRITTWDEFEAAMNKKQDIPESLYLRATINSVRGVFEIKDGMELSYVWDYPSAENPWMNMGTMLVPRVYNNKLFTYANYQSFPHRMSFRYVCARKHTLNGRFLTILMPGNKLTVFNVDENKVSHFENLLVVDFPAAKDSFASIEFELERFASDEYTIRMKRV